MRNWVWCVLFCVVLLVTGLPVEAAPAISARSAVVYEPTGDLVLYDREGDTPLPMASTTKLMTALLAVERLDTDAVLTVPRGAVPVEGTQIGLAVGDRISVRDLLAGLLLASGNDCANALALLMADSMADFAELMNQRAVTLGMVNSHFVTPSGLDEGEHGASARDMAQLAAAVLEHPLLAQLCAAQRAQITIADRKITVQNHNKLLRLYDDCIGLKTGFTKKAGRCLVSAARRDGVTLIVVTLHAPDDWNDHITLYDYGFSRVKEVALSANLPTEWPVAGGVTEMVPLTASLPQSVVVREGECLRVQTEIPRFLWAPVARGDAVGQITVYGNNRVLLQAPIQATQSVAVQPSPGWLTRVGWHICQLWNELLR